MILELLEEGFNCEQIIEYFYPQINEEQIKACGYYANALMKEGKVYFPKEFTF